MTDDKDILEVAKEEIRKSNTGIIHADGKCFVVLKKQIAKELISEVEKLRSAKRVTDAMHADHKKQIESLKKELEEAKKFQGWDTENRKLQEQLEEAKAQLVTTHTSVLDLMSSSYCTNHQEDVKGMELNEFFALRHQGVCQWCAFNKMQELKDQLEAVKKERDGWKDVALRMDHTDDGQLAIVKKLEAENAELKERRDE